MIYGRLVPSKTNAKRRKVSTSVFLVHSNLTPVSQKAAKASAWGVQPCCQKEQGDRQGQICESTSSLLCV